MKNSVKRFDRRWLGAAALLLIAAGTPKVPVPTTKEVAEFRSKRVDSGSYPNAALIAWQRELKTELVSKPLGSAASVLAQRYGIDADVMRRLASAVIVVDERRYEADNSWKLPVQAELHALIPQVRGTPFGTAAIASALDGIEDCRAADFVALMAGATDRAAEAYRIASAAPCTGNFVRAIDVAGGRDLPAILRLLDWGALPRGTALSIYQWLAEPAQMQRIAPEARNAVAAQMQRSYLDALLGAGLDGRALRFYDGLSEVERNRLFEAQPGGMVMIDGIPVLFDAKGGDAPVSMEVTVDDTDLEALADSLEALADTTPVETDSASARRSSEPKKPDPAALAKAAEAARIAKEADIDDGARVALDLAAALAIAGREGEAQRLLATVPQIAVQRRLVRCAYDASGSGGAACAQIRKRSGAGLLLDQWLNHRDEDPYWLAEMLFASSSDDQGLPARKLATKLYPRAAYPVIWSDWERALGSAVDLDREISMGGADTPPIDPMLSRAVSGFAARRDALRTEAASLRVAAGIAQEKPVDRASVTPETPGFAEAKIPQDMRRAKPTPAPKGLAALPKGYLPVRMEREGSRAIAVSVSQTLDPTGEVSQGGYWIHLSEDGGKSWGAPLYTGLADRFPYVVVPASPMKLLAGDAIHLAVDVAEIDTASIYYPPVALRTRRRASDLYLTIPIARLRADRNDDGLNDLAERHLLLDRMTVGAATPFVVGSDASRCARARSPETDARIALLGKLYRASGAAIVEPLDRVGFGFSGWRGAASAENEPIFLRANPADYRCLHARRPIIIYGESDRGELEKMTPDFHMLELPAIQFNRAGDRGYVEWSGGWNGGTYRLRRVNGQWVFDSLSSWIT